VRLRPYPLSGRAAPQTAGRLTRRYSHCTGCAWDYPGTSALRPGTPDDTELIVIDPDARPR